MDKYIQTVRQKNDAYFAETARRPTAFVATFGCQQNEADSEKLRGMADAMGYAQAADAAHADLIVVNTCAIREHAELRALSAIGQYKHLKTKNPNLRIGVCGCMVAQEHRIEELKRSYPYVDFTFEPAALDLFPEILCEALENGKRSFCIRQTSESIREGLPILRESPIKAWVSIMYGCNNFCAYCIVPYVRGRERSRDFSCIVEEVRALVASGTRDITLLGQNVNSYNGGCSFAELIRKLSEIDGDFRLRFMTSHPKDVSDELIAAMAGSGHAARQFHLPMQSGSDRILTAMNRRYDMARYLNIVHKLRAAMPDIALTTDIIVGFPGETESDFEQTLGILREVRFDMLYSFIYSPRKGTPAAALDNPVSEADKSARMQRLLTLQNEISLEINQRLIGKTAVVLAEGKSKNNPDFMTGRTESNKLVHFKAPDSVTGRFTPVRIVRAEPYALYGELEN